MLQIARGAAGRPDDNGDLHFEGNPYELQPGDVVLDGQYAILTVTPGKHNNEAATNFTYCIAEEYFYEVPRGGIPKETGRATLLNNMWIRFKREVQDFDFGEEPNIFYELVDCGHDEHDAYEYEWRGKCKDIPKGMLVGIHMDGPDDKVKMRCKIVDTTYPNGAVVFEDGTVYQSHPDKEWIGWFKEPVEKLRKVGER